MELISGDGDVSTTGAGLGGSRTPGAGLGGSRTPGSQISVYIVELCQWGWLAGWLGHKLCRDQQPRVKMACPVDKPLDIVGQVDLILGTSATQVILPLLAHAVPAMRPPPRAVTYQQARPPLSAERALSCEDDAACALCAGKAQLRACVAQASAATRWTSSARR